MFLFWPKCVKDFDMIWHGLRHVRSEQDSFGEGCVTGGIVVHQCVG